MSNDDIKFFALIVGGYLIYEMYSSKRTGNVYIPPSQHNTILVTDNSAEDYKRGRFIEEFGNQVRISPLLAQTAILSPGSVNLNKNLHGLDKHILGSVISMHDRLRNTRASMF